MMTLKNIVRWFLQWLFNYNLFLDDTDEDLSNSENSGIKLKRQLYATRIYIIAFIGYITHWFHSQTPMNFYISLGLFYILMFAVSMESQTRTVTVSNVSESLFEQIRTEHSETISCPCSNAVLTYDAFVNTEPIFYPICSSAFVEKSWIEKLHIANANLFLPMDFRTTAEAQVCKRIIIF